MLSKRRLAIIASLLALCMAAPCQAELYKWVDEHGRTRYGAIGAERRCETNVESRPDACEGYQVFQRRTLCSLDICMPRLYNTLHTANLPTA